MTDFEAERELFRDGLVERHETAWRELYARHTPALLRLAQLLADSADDADDLVHETWLRAVRGAKRFGGRSALRTWLTGILVNCAREWRRAARRAAAVPLDDEVPASDPEPPAGVERLDLERAVAALAPGYREVLLLHDLFGYTHDEIGGMLDLSPGTSKSQLSRARRAMIRALGGGQGGTND
ncbi:MAG: RNA polymerase sigma factor [Gemmatimonadales bacterium]